VSGCGFQGKAATIPKPSPSAFCYEPDLNRTNHELAMHYGVGVMPLVD
jgi:hypothetical protein